MGKHLNLDLPFRPSGAGFEPGGGRQASDRYLEARVLRGWSRLSHKLFYPPPLLSRSDEDGVCRAVRRTLLRPVRQRLLPPRVRRRLLRPQGHRLLRTSSPVYIGPCHLFLFCLKLFHFLAPADGSHGGTPPSKFLDPVFKLAPFLSTSLSRHCSSNSHRASSNSITAASAYPMSRLWICGANLSVFRDGCTVHKCQRTSGGLG